MLFKYSMKLFFLLSIISIFILNTVHAFNESSENVEVRDDDKKTGEQYYLILVENELKEKKRKGHVKREEKEQFLDALVSEINNLIIGNIDTYEDPSELEKIEQASTTSPFSKRSETEDEEEHKYAYIISSLNDESIIYTYLSEELVPLVNDLPNVKVIVPDINVEYASSNNDNLKEIKNANDWKSSCVKGNTYNYLSLLSQDKYDDFKNDTSYDSNYYYPSSAGEGINIFIIDTGFNFRHPEFSNSLYYRGRTNENKNDRIVQCLVTIYRNGTYNEFNDFCMHEHENYHGSAIADLVGGLTNGVASKANIYGISTTYGNDSPISAFISALEYINNNYLDLKNPRNVEKYIHKIVINMSSAFNGATMFDQKGNHYFVNEAASNVVNYYYKLIGEMTRKGSVFVVSAANYSDSADDSYYPCSFNNVICVGSIDNIGINEDYIERRELQNNEYNTTKYPNHDEWQRKYDEIYRRCSSNLERYIESKNMSSKNYRTAFFSNYGKMVNIYAPGFVKFYYQLRTGERKYYYDWGTSYSAPIVTGVVATIMSEFPYYKFTTEKMLKYLNDVGVKDAIQGIRNGHPNVFINNGNHLKYPESNEYNTCGYNSSNQLCSKSSELNCFTHGCCLKSDV